MLKLASFMLTFFLSFLFLLLLPEIVKVQRVSCESQFGNCLDRIIVESELEGLKLSRAKRELNEGISGLDFVEDFELAYEPPRGLSVFIKEKTVAIEIDGVFYSAEGEAISGKNDEVTRISASRKPDRQEIAFVASVSQILGLRNASIVADRLETNIAGVDFILPLTGDDKLTAGKVRLILSQLNSLSQETKIKEVDLRFASPVLR